MAINRIIFKAKQRLELCCLKKIQSISRGYLSNYFNCDVCGNYILPERSKDIVIETNLALKQDNKEETRELVGILFNEELYTEGRALQFTQTLFKKLNKKTCSVSVYSNGGMLRIMTTNLNDTSEEPVFSLLGAGVLGVFTELHANAI